VSAATGARFEFGKNWSRFLERVDEQRIGEAEASLRDWLEADSLAGRSFLDIGSGSGLFSLAARRLGATVHSFDYDSHSVACTAELRRRYRPEDAGWTVERGDVLDGDYLARLGRFDVVYSWGVLHHTGAMWRALQNATSAVKPGGVLYIAIYNDQGWRSRVWRVVKRTYNLLPGGLRWLVLGPVVVQQKWRMVVHDARRGDPLRRWRANAGGRGMSMWTDLVDWVGGYPFEVAAPGAVVAFCEARGFRLRRLFNAGAGPGCNQFTFEAAETTVRAGAEPMLDSRRAPRRQRPGAATDRKQPDPTSI